MTGTLRLDKYLWFARIVKKREWAQTMAEAGHLRIDGRAVDRAAVAVKVGQVLSFATHGGRVRAIRVLGLPTRRVGAGEVAALYQELLGARTVDGSDDAP